MDIGIGLAHTFAWEQANFSVLLYILLDFGFDSFRVNIKLNGDTGDTPALHVTIS